MCSWHSEKSRAVNGKEDWRPEIRRGWAETRRTKKKGELRKGIKKTG